MIKQVLIFFLIFALFGCAEKRLHRIDGRTMGTNYMVKLVEPSMNEVLLENLKKDIDTHLKEVNRKMSTYQKDSEISRFNRRHSEAPMQVSSEFVAVLRLAVQMHKESQGAFDVTVAPLVDLWGFGTKGTIDAPPPQDSIDAVLERIGTQHLQIINDSTIAKSIPHPELDLSAIAKGYGVDVVAGLLLRKGFTNFLVEIGGEVVVKGLKGREPWRIGVDQPDFGARPGKNLKKILALTDVAMATSGDYRQYFVSEDQTYTHTIDPQTGRPIVNGVASVTVLAPECVLADAMATAIMVMGADKGMQWVESRPEVEAYIILREEAGYREMQSSGFGSFVNEEMRKE